MNVLPLKRLLRPATLLVLLAAAPGLFLAPGCDLAPETYDTLTPERFYQTEDEFLAAVVPVYNQLDILGDGYYWWGSQISTDEMILPTRGQDWGDNGTWRRLHRQEWTPTDPVAGNSWNEIYTGVARANSVLGNLGASEQTPLPEETVAGFQAELRTLRAFYYYALMDFFGGVPIVTAPEVDSENPPASTTRAEVFDFVESELRASLPDLPLERTGSEVGRVTKGAAQAILANMYLNAEVFRGEVTPSGLQRGEPMNEEALALADTVINSGVYSLADDFFENFVPSNGSSPETIFAVQHVDEGGPQFNYFSKTLHYDQWPQGCCNGLAALASSYDTFSDDDLRKNMFLEGRAQNLFTGEPAFTRQDEPLIFTREVPIRGATEGNGIRPLKWPVDENDRTDGMQNDYAFFRLAEMHLIKAEALYRLGRTAEALDQVNLLRERAFEPDQPLTMEDVSEAGGMEEVLLAARMQEFHSEAKRRQDLIRFGRFTSGTWSYKDESEPYRVLYPVPQEQLSANDNPDFVQNPGY